MQVSVETTTGLERRMTVAMPKKDIDSEVQKRLKSLSGRAKIDGFRPGKVPFGVVQKKYGGQVQSEVLNDMMQSSFYEAVSQEKLRPAGVPLIEPGDTDSKDNVEFTATFEVYPEFELKGFSKIKVNRPVLEIGDAYIDKMLETIRKQRKTWQGVDRAGKNGDQVTVDFVGTINGEEFQDVSDLAGKPVEFATKVHKVEESILPELDDEFIANFGIKEGGLEALKKQVRDNMEREAQQSISASVKEQLFDGLVGLKLLDVPRALIDGEIETLVKQRQEAMQQYGGGQMPETNPSELEDQARRRVALGLILAEVIKKNDIKVPPARLREKVEQIAAGYEHSDEVIKYYYSDKSRLAELENVTIEEMAIDSIMEEAKVTDKTTSFDDLMNPGQTAS
jgi:trigger factor